MQEPTVESAQITVRYVNPPQQGKKNASIKTDDNQLYFVSPDMLSQFEQGGKYNVQYKINVFRGVQYRHVASATKMASAAPQSGGKAYGKVDDTTAERIFVCGALNAMLHGQNSLDVQTLTAWVNILRETWRQTLGNPQQDAELNDEIPY